MNKNKPDWQKLLFRVLKEHGAFKAYENGIKQYRKESVSCFLEKHKETAISSAFCWRDVPLGHEFWCKIDFDYRTKLYELKERNTDACDDNFLFNFN